MAILSPDEARRMARMEFAIVVQTDLCAFLNAAQNFPNMSKENICLLILQFPEAAMRQHTAAQCTGNHIDYRRKKCGLCL